MDTVLDQSDPIQSDAEFEAWLDEINALTPDMAEVERVYWERRQAELESKMAEMGAF